MDKETTCVLDSRIPIKFDSTKMFCYEHEYVSIAQCQSRTPSGKCGKFQSIKDSLDETKGD
jgi:hypothetical protein